MPIRNLLTNTNKYRFARFVPRGNGLVLLLYVSIFALLLGRAVRGVGQYWDWTFPFYASQVGNFFGRASQSWTEIAGGSPLGYSSDYFVRFCISLFGWVTPELLLYGLVLILFTIGGCGVYAIARHHVKPFVAFLFGLAAFVNPTIFYKFTAGHIDYLISYVVIIILIYFLLYRFRPTIRHAVVVGLLLAIIGAQIQFFAIAGLLIAVFFLFRRDLWRWYFLLPFLALPILINAVWLSNFIFGGADIERISGEATKGSFKAASNSNYLNIFSFSFSKATLISRFYAVYELLLYGLLFVFMLVALLRSKRKQSEDVWLLTSLLLLMFLATGLFQLANLGPLTTLYPMFREVGHFAPVIVLIMFLLLARLLPKGGMKAVCVGWLLLLVGISFIKYQTSTQTLNFSASRQLFAEFKAFDEKHADKDQRVLGYPFFEQYSFKSFPIDFQDNLPLKNVGHDNFSTYSDQQFIKNAIKPQDFKLSLQYRLLKTLDVDILKPHNIRYIYDFSDIYESYYERYVPPSTYDGEVGWIKNIPGLMDQLIAQNPGKIKRVSPHILEVTDYTPRVSTAEKIYSVASSEEGDNAAKFMEKVFPSQRYSYVDRSVSDVPRGSGRVAPLFADAQPDMINSHERSLTQRIKLGNNPKVFSNTMPSVVTYEAKEGVVTFYAASSGKLYANNQLVLNNDNNIGRQVLGTVKMPAGQDFYIGLEGEIKPLARNGSAVLGHVSGGGALELYTGASENAIANPSFESGLWQQKVGDCNNYDDKPDIAQRLDESTANDGNRSLELSARRHDACSSAQFNLKGDTTYLLSYDYQSPNTDTASFYLRFNNTDKDAIKRFQSIADNEWHTVSQPITTPSGTTTGQLLLHALASDKDQPTINRYDNIRLVELQKVSETPIDTPEVSYDMHTLGAFDETTFKFVDSSYDYTNAFINGSFEDGPWRSKVADCNNYDTSPQISMNLDKGAKTDGSQSLRLDATKHTACTYTNVSVQAGSDYILSFDYKSDNPAAQLGYYAEFNGGDNGYQQRITPTDRSWHTYTAKIRVPALTPSMQFYLHAHEDNGIAANTVHFDNIKMTAIPSLEQQFYAVSEPQAELQKPQRIQFHTDSQTHRTITVTGAKGPFAVLLSETYHPSWRLELDSAGANSWLPTASVQAVPDHFEASGYANGWYVDPSELCANARQGCTLKPDGSYDINLVAEFVPQRWFEISRFVSVATLIGVGSYLALTHQWRRRSDEEGVYRHPLAWKRK